MKVYSSDAVTKDQVEVTAAKAAMSAANAVDKKQTEQIKKLRIWCGALTLVSLVSLFLHLLHV